MRAGREGEANILFSLAEKKTVANSRVLYLSSLSPLYCEPWSLVQCLSHGHSSYYWALSTRCLANYSSLSCLNVTPHSAFAIVKPRVYCKWMFCWEELFFFFSPRDCLDCLSSFVCLLSVLDRANTFTGRDVFPNNEHEMNIVSNCSSNHQRLQGKLQPETHSVSGQE